MDHFHNGIDISSAGEPVRPMARGEILLTRQESDDPFMPVPGAGNYVFIDHGQGWWSGYYHLDSILKERTGPVNTETIIGTTGNTGHSYGAHLHFFLIKDAGKTYINPLEVLPTIEDQNPPNIGQLTIVTKKGSTLVSHSRRENIRLTQPYPVLITIIDPGLEKSTRRGIYKIKFKLNQNKEEELKFTDLMYSENGWLMEGRKTFNEVYKNNLYYLGDLVFENGTNKLEVEAWDYSGNSRQVVFDINVERQY